MRLFLEKFRGGCRRFEQALNSVSRPTKMMPSGFGSEKDVTRDLANDPLERRTPFLSSA